MAIEKTWWQKYRKDVFKALALVTLVVVAVMGWHWTDTADTPFWSGFWNVAALVALLVWVCGWVYFWNKDKTRRQ